MCWGDRNAWTGPLALLASPAHTLIGVAIATAVRQAVFLLLPGV
jgi:hypothetical protein